MASTPKATFDADFGKFVAELDKVEVKLRRFEPAADKSTARLQRMADSLNGQRMFEQAAIATRAIDAVGGAATFSRREVAKFAAQFDEVASKAKAMNVSLGASFDRVHADLRALRGDLSAVDTAAAGAGRGFGALRQAALQGLGIGAGLGAAGAVSALASGIKTQLTDIVAAGDAYARLSKGFVALQGGATVAKGTLEGLRSATRGLVTDTDLMLAANQANVLGLQKLGVDLQESARIAARLGAALGKDATTSIEQFNLALAKGSSERLDELGIALKLTQAYDEYAARLGKTADALTDVEKSQAFAVIGLEKGREVLRRLGDDSLTAGQELDRLGTAFSNLQAQVGSFGTGTGVFAEAIGGVADSVTGLARSIEDARQAYADLLGLVPGTGAGASLVGLSAKALIDAATAGPRAIAGAIIAVRNQGQAAGLVDIPLPGVTTGTIRDADGTVRPAAAPVSLGSKAGPPIRTTFTQKELEFAEKTIDAAIARSTQQNARIDAAAKARQQRLDALTGRTRLRGAQQSVADVFGKRGVGVSALTDASALKIYDDLADAKVIAARVAPGLVAGFSLAMEQLAGNRAVLQRVTQDAGKKLLEGLFNRNALRAGVLTGVNTLERELSGKLTQMMRSSTAVRQSVIDAGEGLISGAVDPNNVRTSARSFAGLIGEANLAAIYGGLDRTQKKTVDWAQALGTVSQAFANLSQIAGGAFDGISRTLGGVFGAADAALQTVQALGEQFKSLIGGGKDGKGLSGRGAALAGGLAGLGTGSQLGGLFTNRGAGFAAGAAGGASSAFLATAGTPIAPYAAAIGALVGGFAGMWTAAANAKGQRRAKDVSASQLTAQFGGLDKTLDLVGGLGLSQQSFLEGFYGKPEQFAKQVTILNEALEKERLTAEKLAKSLGDVARVQGVLSREDARTIAQARPGSAAEQAATEFVRQQRDQAQGGLGQAVAGLTSLASITDAERDTLLTGISDRTEQARIIDARLNQKARQVVTDYGLSVKAAGAGLFALFDDAIRRGESAVTALGRLRDPIASLQDIYARSGATPGAGFQQLQSFSSIVNDPTTGPAVQIGAGLGSALSGLQNSGLLSPELFSDISAGIAESFFNLERFGKGGVDAARLLQPGLQAIWQLQQDFGHEVDANTQKLLDFASQNGLIGDKFRPAEERLLAGFDRMADKLGTFIDLFTTDLVDDAGTGAERAGRAIEGVFSRLRPRVTVEFVTPDPNDVLGRGTPAQQQQGTQAARTATSGTGGGGVYLDGALVGYHTARQLDGVANFIGA